MIRVGAWHGIVAMTAPWMAAADAVGSKETTLQRTVTFQRLKCIGRTGRLIAAPMADPRGQEQPIGTYRQGGEMCERRHCTPRCTLRNACSRSMRRSA